MKKILVVDDSEPDQFFAKVIIERFNPKAEILQAYDGEEALDVLSSQETAPDIIFLDINMPRMNGYEFLDIYCRDNRPRPLIAMLTSSSQAVDRERAAGYDCVAKYLVKPLNVESLEEVESCLA